MKFLASTTFFAAMAGLVQADLQAYRATIEPIPGTESSVAGTILVFTGADPGVIGYGGYITGLEAGLDGTACTGNTGCGVSIHNGNKCNKPKKQFFNVDENPWTDAKYYTDADGNAQLSGSLMVGLEDVNNRVFVVYGADGSSVGCGKLAAVPEEELFLTALEPLGSSTAEGMAAAVQVDDTDIICYSGYAMDLEPDLLSVYASQNGTDCEATNGCGVHVHAGTDCTSPETQLGHFYNAALGADPWATVGYDSTNEDGEAYFMDCVATGETDYYGRALIVHADDGSRVACGLLEYGSMETDGMGNNTAPVDPVDPDDNMDPVDTPSSVTDLKAYQATITPIPGTDSGVTGTVMVFTGGTDMTTVGYGGYVTGLQAGLQASTCTATNGCGVHIHSGTGCEDAQAQGGHYFAGAVTEDPWVEARYSSDVEGNSQFSDRLLIGTDDVEGRAFVVHAEDGSRVGCGILEAIDPEDLFMASLDPLGESTAKGMVAAMQVEESDMICYAGYAMNLELNLLSVYANEVGTDCAATNGCGVHVHAGTDCSSPETQLGHFYNSDVLDGSETAVASIVDPWALIGYDSTNAFGQADFMDCVRTGETDYEGRAFIVHANDGSRVACGLLELPDDAVLGDDDDGDDDDDDEPVDGSAAAGYHSMGALLTAFVLLLSNIW